MHTKQVTNNISPSHRNQRLQCYDWWEKLFDQQVKNDVRTYHNIWNIVIGQVDNNTTVCLLDYVYFKDYYKVIATGLSKQQTLDADPKAVQQINFAGNLDQAGIATMFFIIKEGKKHFRFFARNCESIVNLFSFNTMLI